MEDRSHRPEQDSQAASNFGAPDPATFSDTAQAVERAQGGSTTGFDPLWRRFVPALEVALAGKLRGFADTRLRLRLLSEIPDILQATMLKASMHLGEFEYRGTGSLLAWLRQIAHNEFTNRLEYWLADCRDVNRERRSAARSGTFAGLPEPPAAEPGPRTSAEIGEQRMRVGAALETLVPALRHILFFRFFGGAEWDEIAEQLDYPSADAVRMECTRKAIPAFILALGRIDTPDTPAS